MMPILLFPYWKKEFHVHVDLSCIAFEVVLTQLGARDIDHPISFTGQKLSRAERNYSTTKHKGLAMVYALHRFRNYLLGVHFNMYTYHFGLNYLVNKLVLGGNL